MDRLTLLIFLSCAGKILAVPAVSVADNGKTDVLPVEENDEYESVKEQIVGGRNAPLGAFPYQVSLQGAYSNHFCGGAIINNLWIVTAAHCLQGKYFVKVVVGTNRLDSGGVAYRGVRLIIHPNYGSFYRNDIALIRVERPIAFNNIVQPVALPRNSNMGGGYRAVISGWGQLGVNSIYPMHLQYLETMVLDHYTCRRYSTGVTNTNICTLHSVGHGNCYGDSGGPLVSNGMLIGVVSWGNPCARGAPDIYTRVSSYVPWIQQTIRMSGFTEE